MPTRDQMIDALRSIGITLSPESISVSYEDGTASITGERESPEYVIRADFDGESTSNFSRTWPNGVEDVDAPQAP